MPSMLNLMLKIQSYLNLPLFVFCSTSIKEDQSTSSPLPIKPWHCVIYHIFLFVLIPYVLSRPLLWNDVLVV